MKTLILFFIILSLFTSNAIGQMAGKLMITRVDSQGATLVKLNTPKGTTIKVVPQKGTTIVVETTVSTNFNQNVTDHIYKAGRWSYDKNTKNDIVNVDFKINMQSKKILVKGVELEEKITVLLRVPEHLIVETN